MRLTTAAGVLLLLLTLSFCRNKEQKDCCAGPQKQLLADTAIMEQLPGDTAVPIEDEMATYYIVVADTGADYYLLRTKMFDLHKQLQLDIDTLGRAYNPQSNLIALPENDEDEIYRGEYYPRRYPSKFLSLEYLSWYQDHNERKTIALVAGIYEDNESADSALLKLKKEGPQAFVLKARVYVGCMH